MAHTPLADEIIDRDELEQDIAGYLDMDTCVAYRDVPYYCVQLTNTIMEMIEERLRARIILSERVKELLKDPFDANVH